VQGLLLTRNAVSPTVSAWWVGISLVGFTALYGLLALVEARLMIRAAQAGPDGAGAYEPAADAPAKLPALSY